MHAWAGREGGLYCWPATPESSGSADGLAADNRGRGPVQRGGQQPHPRELLRALRCRVRADRLDVLRNARSTWRGHDAAEADVAAVAARALLLRRPRAGLLLLLLLLLPAARRAAARLLLLRRSRRGGCRLLRARHMRRMAAGVLRGRQRRRRVQERLLLGRTK